MYPGGMSELPWPFLNPDALMPELRAAFGDSPPDFRTVRLQVTIPLQEPNPGRVNDAVVVPREDISIASDSAVWEWRTGSLRALFRGERQPPSLGDYPEAYRECFALIESHLVQYCEVMGDRRDQEMEEIFGTLRRRPDGRSLGPVHDYLWKVSAWLLGIHPLSGAEYEAIVGRLERSCRRFAMGPSSRNYLATLNSMFR